jgi:hypothetical protein
MNFKRKMALPVVLAIGALGLLVLSQAATASHPRPKGATPLRASTVPAYKACTVPNSTHGAPLPFGSCNPPVQSSNFLTVGSPDANGAGANSIGFIQLDVHAGVPGPPEDSDVLINSSISDVRCKPATSVTVCGTTNGADGPDYSGELQGNALIRITDHYNGASLTDAATVTDIPFPVNGTCAATTSTTTGGQCDTHTSANGVLAGSVKDTKRAVVEIQQLQVSDGGADGVVATTDNTLFEVQGIFIP